MQMICEQGVAGAARSAGVAAAHDLRLYNKEMYEHLRQKNSIMYDPTKTRQNVYMVPKNRYSALFVQFYKEKLSSLKKVQGIEEWKKIRAKLGNELEKAMREEIVKQFTELKRAGKIPKRRGWQAKRNTYNIVISLDKELRNEYMQGHIKKEDLENAMKQGMKTLEKKLGMQRIYAAIHYDESTPHMHLLYANICEDGKALTGKLRLRKTKGKEYQMSYKEYTKQFNMYAEDYLREKGYNNIHLKPSWQRKSGEHKDVTTLRKEYFEKLRKENAELKRQLETLQKQMSKDKIVTAVVAEGVSNTQEVIRHGQHRER